MSSKETSPILNRNCSDHCRGVKLVGDSNLKSSLKIEVSNPFNAEDINRYVHQTKGKFTKPLFDKIINSSKVTEHTVENPAHKERFVVYQSKTGTQEKYLTKQLSTSEEEDEESRSKSRSPRASTSHRNHNRRSKRKEKVACRCKSVRKSNKRRKYRSSDSCGHRRASPPSTNGHSKRSSKLK